MSAFLQLPRELRDIIYGYYLHCDGGYVYHAESQRFRQPNGDAVCHALALTCRQIASELNGLAFQLNSITFSATYSTSTQMQAAFHHNFNFMHKFSKKFLLKQIAPKLFTHEMAQVAAKAYSEFAPIVNVWMTQGDMETLWQRDHSFGEAMSVWEDFVQHILDLISEHPAYVETVKALPKNARGVERGRDPLQLKDLDLYPWVIADLPELIRLSDVILEDSSTSYYYKSICYTYSAAAIALRFLDSCSASIRASVRKLYLKKTMCR